MNKRNNARELSVYEKIKKKKEISKKEISNKEIIDILQEKYDLKDFIEEKSNNNCQDFFNGNTKKSINHCKTQNEKITAFINYVVNKNKKLNEKDFDFKLKLLNLALASPVVTLPIDASPVVTLPIDASPVVTLPIDASPVVTSQLPVNEEYPDDFENFEDYEKIEEIEEEKTPRKGGSRTKKRRGTRRKNNKKRSNKKRSNKKLR